MNNHGGIHLSVQATLTLIRAIGSPAAGGVPRHMTPEQLEASYDTAFANRVALLLLTAQERQDWPEGLRGKLHALQRRESMTLSVVADLARVLERICPDEYVVFKSLKPFPATPNDTDVLFLGSKRAYQRAYAALLEEGYLFHEWAPLQQTLVDPRGVGQVGAGKKGGTYYIDFYQEVATDYFAYMNKNRLRPFLRRGELLGAPICLLRSEPELAIILFHSVFPERTYQLEHFFLALHYMAQESFDRQSFVEFGRANGMVRALRESLAITRALHVSAFGVDPSTVEECLQRLGGRSTEGARLRPTTSARHTCSRLPPSSDPSRRSSRTFIACGRWECS